MQILPMSSLTMTPTVSALLGTTMQGNVLADINKQYGDGNVVFGSPGNPISERFQALKNVVQDQLIAANEQIAEIKNQIVNPFVFTPIESEEQLRTIPEVMKLPILMYAPVRKLFEEERLGGGWNYEAQFLPKEDFFGRLIDNGTYSNDPNDYADGKIPEYASATFESTDPDLDEVALNAIARTRAWINEWLKNEMSEGGKWRDPTDLGNHISRVAHHSEEH